MRSTRFSTGRKAGWALAILIAASAPAIVSGQQSLEFIRGDCNVDGSADISDAIFVLLFNFGSGVPPACLDACDVNDDGAVTGQVTDAVYLLTYSFGGGPPPPAPGPTACGPDPTPDAVDCQAFGACVQPPDPCPLLSVSSTATQRNADVDVAPSGNILVVWEDDRDLDGSYQIRAGSFTPDFADLLDPFTVNTVSSGQQFEPAIAMSKDETFVAVWQDDSNGNGLFEVRARGFQADGTERFPQFTVNVASRGQQQDPDVAVDDAGNFVVVWEDDAGEDGLFEIHARGFGADGLERIPQFTVNVGSAGQQADPVVAMSPAGEFVVVWEDDRNANGLFEIKARGFDANGAERIPQFTVNTHGSGQQVNPAVAMDASGNFVVVWEDDRDSNGEFQIHAKGFTAAGVERIPQFTVNVLSAGQQLSPTVAMDRAGNFAVAWAGDRDGDGEFHVRMRAFDATGAERIAPLKVDCLEPRQHLDPAIALAEDGRVLVFWDDIDPTEVSLVVGLGFDGSAPPVSPQPPAAPGQ